MSQREATVVWLRDILEHLSVRQKQLEWVDDSHTISLLTENMLRDLERCQRLCQQLQKRHAREKVA